ncbi:hypothetical protein MMC29_001037 [Sticta canariensis]|nr:hypothetical protein [Sticta canariensis]
MSGQNGAQKPIKPYTTDCYAEFYDLWNGSFWPPQSKDIAIIWDAVQSLIASRKNDQESGPINVIDVGCGTGRVLKDLLERSRDSATPLPNVKFYGVDLSRTMLRRGEAYLQVHPDLQKIAQVEWVNASGEQFTSVLPQLKNSCDIVAWSGGGFSHLDSEEKQLLFLRQMAVALRSHPSSALGIIPVLDQSIPSRAADPATSEVFEVPWKGLSVENPDVTYFKSVNEVFWKGPVRHDCWTISVRETKSGEELHSEQIEHTLLNLDEDKWPSLVKQAGLQISRVQELPGWGLIYFLQKIF